MKTIINGCGLIAVACLLTARLGAEETVYYATDTGTTAAAHVFGGQSAVIAFGAPAGLNKSERLNEFTAIDSSIPTAWSIKGINSYKLHADSFRHNYDLIKTRQLVERLSLYYGIGGRMRLKETDPGTDNNDDDTRLGMRSPLGVSYVLYEKPVELFAEVVPILDILPETRLGVGVGIGTRYYFSLL